jgi:hypothetical protein
MHFKVFLPEGEDLGIFHRELQHSNAGQKVYFYTNVSILVHFGVPCNGKCWNILLPRLLLTAI